MQLRNVTRCVKHMECHCYWEAPLGSVNKALYCILVLSKQFRNVLVALTNEHSPLWLVASHKVSISLRRQHEIHDMTREPTPVYLEMPPISTPSMHARSVSSPVAPRCMEEISQSTLRCSSVLTNGQERLKSGLLVGFPIVARSCLPAFRARSYLGV